MWEGEGVGIDRRKERGVVRENRRERDTKHGEEVGGKSDLVKMEHSSHRWVNMEVLPLVITHWVLKYCHMPK